MTVKHKIGELMPATKVMGRPTRYQDSYVEQGYQLCKLGAIDRELASAFDVSEQTINTWKKIGCTRTLYVSIRTAHHG
ncbi:MAG: hypothetical protein RIQ94_2595 [Pseudomonadota bacterium]